VAFPESVESLISLESLEPRISVGCCSFGRSVGEKDVAVVTKGYFRRRFFERPRIDFAMLLDELSSSGGC
jgi:hypothetical protein